MKRVAIPVQSLPPETQKRLQDQINLILDKLHRPRIKIVDAPGNTAEGKEVE